MPSGQPITDADRGRILRILDSELSVRQVARRVGLRPATVNAVMRAAAVAWWRERVAAAGLSDLADRE